MHDELTRQYDQGSCARSSSPKSRSQLALNLLRASWSHSSAGQSVRPITVRSPAQARVGPWHIACKRGHTLCATWLRAPCADPVDEAPHKLYLRYIGARAFVQKTPQRRVLVPGVSVAKARAKPAPPRNTTSPPPRPPTPPPPPPTPVSGTSLGVCLAYTSVIPFKLVSVMKRYALSRDPTHSTRRSRRRSKPEHARTQLYTRAPQRSWFAAA